MLQLGATVELVVVICVMVLVEVKSVVGWGFTVRMQEHALLSREAG